MTCGTDGYVNQRTISPLNSTLDWRTVIDNTKSVLTCKYSTTGKIGIGCTDGKMYTLRSNGVIDKNQGKVIKDVDYSPNQDRYLYGACNDNKVWQMDTNGGGSLSTAYTGGD